MEEIFGKIVSVFFFKKVQQWKYTYISDIFRYSELDFMMALSAQLCDSYKGSF